MLASALINLGAVEPPGLPNSADTSQRNEDAVFKYLLPVANSCRKPVRVYYRATLLPKEGTFQFPSVVVQPPRKGTTGLAAVREIFAKDKNVKVTEDGGIIRIWIGKVPTAILDAKLTRLVLTPEAQYSPDKAFHELVNSKEMVRAEKALKYTPPLAYSISPIEPDEKLPHLPATISDTTAEQVLDKMAKTWAGDIIVIYGASGEKDNFGETNFVLESAGQIG
jgi:hypothetical protein